MTDGPDAVESELTGPWRLLLKPIWEMSVSRIRADFRVTWGTVALATVFVSVITGFNSKGYAVEKSFTIEDINDPGITTHPVPPPVHLCTYTYDISTKSHEEVIEVHSTHLRNVSITMENVGDGLVKAPYLFGPLGWDFRSQEVLAEQITRGAKSDEEKFFRIHEWDSLYLMRCEGGTGGGTGGDQDPLLYINRSGHMMCGEHAVLVASLINCLEPRGEMKARAVPITGHETGEVYFDGRWRAFDASPGIRWVYFDYDDTTPVTWEQITHDPTLTSRIYPVTGWKLGKHEIVRYDYEGRRAGEVWDFNYDLLPNESVTMHFDMQGRVDRKGYHYSRHAETRTPCDYGSAVFAFRPDFSKSIYKQYVVEEENIAWTADGLVPIEPATPSYVIFGVNKYPWTLAGADIRANFKTDGKVYAAAASSFRDTEYRAPISWVLLSETEKEGLVDLEGKAAYWVKFEFQGRGSGLTSAEIASEVQVNPWALPGLEYGLNRIRFEADNMGGSALRVTYRYDDQSRYHTYEPATANYGRHIFFRVGGTLFKTGHKPEFWEKLATDPSGGEEVTVAVYKAAGQDAFKQVRTLIKDTTLRWGYYRVYWDGRDDDGNICPANEMYSYRVFGSKPTAAAERLYLFPQIWPVPNEVRETGE